MAYILSCRQAGNFGNNHRLHGMACKCGTIYSEGDVAGYALCGVQPATSPSVHALLDKACSDGYIVSALSIQRGWPQCVFHVLECTGT